MHALVVYESMFGNTQTIAEAIAEGVSAQMAVEILEAGEAPEVISRDVALLIVGGPTHQFGMPRASSRRDAARQADRPLVSGGIGIREWLSALSRDAEIAAAAFDTRLDRPRWLWIMGSASGKIAKRLRRLGFHVRVPAEHFHVSDLKGPLLEGEIPRAREWGERVALDVTGSIADRQAA
jgi:hypothetical protein